MPGPPSDRSHPLDATWPEFLDLVDSDPDGAMGGLYVFTWKLLMGVSMPGILRRLTPADREDCTSEFVAQLANDDFRKLRQYSDRGRPFRSWLVTSAFRFTCDWLRRRKETPTDSAKIESALPPHRDKEVDPRLKACVEECFELLTPKCRAYLACLADGMTPKEVVAFFHFDLKANAAVSDDTRYCKKRLRELLEARGLREEEVRG